MIRKSLIVFFVIIYAQIGCSQNAFKVLFQNPLDEWVSDIAEGANNTYYAVGGSGYNFQPWDFRGLAYRMRSSSDTLSRHISFNDTVTRFFKIVKDQGNDFLVIGTICNPPEYNERLLIAGMDTNLNILWRKEYQLKEYDRFWKIEYFRKNENSIIVFGDIGLDSLGGQQDLFFAEITYSGDTIKTGYYLPHNPYVHTGTFNSDSSRIWIFGEGFDYNGRGERAEFDTNFLIRRIDWLPVVVDGYSNARWYSDNKMLFMGRYTVDYTPQDDDVGISFMDTALNTPVIHYFGSQDTIDYPGAERCFDFKDTNHIFFTGTHNIIFDFYPQGVSWLMAGLLDHDLNTVYYYLYGGDAYYIASSILATSDGGSIIAATRYDYRTQYNERDNYFLKLDQYGLITSSGSPKELVSTTIQLYPNPGTDNIRLLGVSEGTLELYAADGREVLTRQIDKESNIISVSKLPSGYYYYRIFDKHKIEFTGKWVKM